MERTTHNINTIVYCKIYPQLCSSFGACIIITYYYNPQVVTYFVCLQFLCSHFSKDYTIIDHTMTPEMPKLGHKSLEFREFYDVIFMVDKGMEHEKKVWSIS